ncbi:MAG: hypothetical protein JXA37_01760 [Chloroflexia bacterium]|nr:hypothetical protein [Chloroflexia bacterium]
MRWLRQDAWPAWGLLVLLAALLGVSLAYQYETAHVIDVGASSDLFYLQGFHEREPVSPQEAQERYRWSEGRASLHFPGLGRRARQLSLRLLAWRPAGQPPPTLQVRLNGRPLADLVVGPEWKEYTLWVPVQYFDLSRQEVELEVEPFVPAEVGAGGDPRVLGVVVSEVALLPIGGPGWSWAWPAWDQLAWALLLALALYLGGIAVGLLPRWSALLAGLAVGGLSTCLALYRLRTALYSHRLALLALLGLLLLPLLRWLFRRVFAWGRVPLAESELRLLLALFLFGFLLKAGGLLYPYSVAWDLRWHLEKSQRVVSGRLDELYQPGYFSQEVMPPEWGGVEERPMIPYSPYYHITAAAFFFLPWRPYDTANVLSVLLDVTKPMLIYFLACRLGLSRRAGRWAAILYAVLPATFLLHAWGNTPTQTGLWWTLAATCYIVGGWERLKQPRTWAGLALFLLGALLYYTVTAAFMGIFVLLLLLGLALNGRRLNARPLGAILLALLLAVGLATLIYYGQYIRPIVEVTLPYFQKLAREGGGGGVVPVPWSVYLRQHLERLSSLRYGLVWPMFLGLAGLVVGRKHWRRPLPRWLLLAWFGSAFVFFIVGFRVDMVDKEIFYAMPALCLCAGLGLDWLWRRGRAGRLLLAAFYLFQLAASLQTWIYRLSTVIQEWYAHDLPIVGL